MEPTSGPERFSALIKISVKELVSGTGVNSKLVGFYQRLFIHPCSDKVTYRAVLDSRKDRGG